MSRTQPSPHTHKPNPFRWLTLAGAAVAAYPLVIRPWHLHWGATDAEIKKPLPGDEFVPTPKLNATHAITIEASPQAIWPWLAQMGQGRGGFYSYTWIENLMGLHIHNADRILPEFQDLKVGDEVPLAPQGFGIPVARLEPEHLLVLHGDTREAKEPVFGGLKPGDYFNVVWGFHLFSINAQTTRLIERWRADWNSTLANTVLMRALLEPGAFVMERGMLLGLKHRVEAARLAVA